MRTHDANYVAAACASGDVREWNRRLSLVERLSRDEGPDRELLTFVSGHVRKYGAMPSRKLVEATAGQDMSAPSEPAAYYYDQMRYRAIREGMDAALEQAGSMMSAINPGYDPDGALALIRNATVELAATCGQHVVTDLRTADDRVARGYDLAIKGKKEPGLTLGWPSLDESGPDLGPGELFSIVGRPKTGKSWLMIRSAVHAWRQGVPVMFVTQEMSGLRIEQRAAAMLAGLPLTPLLRGEQVIVPGTPKGGKTDYADRLHDALEAMRDHPVPFWTVDGQMASTVADTAAMVAAMKPGAVWWDGAYLLRHPDPRVDGHRYTRVAENVDLIKRTLTEHGIPGGASFQFGRDAAKKAKKKTEEDPDLEDIGMTDAVGQHSSLVLGLLQSESVETLHRRRVLVMAGRDGAHGSFEIRWDFMRTDFSEWEEPPVEDLDLNHV